MRKPIAATLLVVVAFASTGCFGFDYGDPGPLEVKVVDFHTTTDRWHGVWEIHFTNTGTEPITYIHARSPSKTIHDGGKFRIEGRDYVSADVGTTKVWVGLGRDANWRNQYDYDINHNPGVIWRDEPLLPGQTTNATHYAFFDHQNGSYGDWGHVVNDTDFYDFGFTVKYSDGSYEWEVNHNLACYNALGEQIYYWGGDRVGDGLNCPMAIGPTDAPKWERYVPTPWKTRD